MRYIILLVALWAGAASADSLWFTTRGGANMDEAWAVATDARGGIYWATHQTVPYVWPDIHLYRLTPDGQPVWHTVFGDSSATMAYVVTLYGSHVYVGGAIWNTTADMVVACFDTADGHEVWRYVWDQGYGYEEVDGLIVDSTGVYVAGWTMSQNTSLDLAVMRLSPDGQQVVWRQIWGTPNWDEENGQIVVDDRNVYVSGRYNAPSSLFGGDALLAAFRKDSGFYQWHRTWGGLGTDDAFGMTGDGHALYPVGITNSFGNGTQIFLLRYDYAGNLAWDTVFGGAGEDLSRCVAVGTDGFIYVGGKTTSFGAQGTDVLLVQFDTLGAPRWYRLWGGAGTDETHGIALAGDNVYIAGQTTSFGAGSDDALLIKARRDGTFPAGVFEAPAPAPRAGRTLRVSVIGRQVRISGGPAAFAQLHVFDRQGRLVREATYPPSGEAVLDAADWPDGVYVCRVQAGAEAATGKFVLARQGRLASQ